MVAVVEVVMHCPRASLSNIFPHELPVLESLAGNGCYFHNFNEAKGFQKANRNDTNFETMFQKQCCFYTKMYVFLPLL